MARQPGTFNKTTNRGTKVCINCGERRQDANMQGETCIPCFDAAGIENAHADGMHDETPAEDCPECMERADADRAAILAAIVTPKPVGRVCECACGGSPKGKKSRFLPGHDMRVRK